MNCKLERSIPFQFLLTSKCSSVVLKYMRIEKTITLREINAENWRECIGLRVREEQARFVATNENALALAYAHSEMRPKGIYANETMVGFLMYAKDPDDGLYYINRLMIDARHQGNGYGRRALILLADHLASMGAETLDILHKPDNHFAVRIYREIGFEPSGLTVGDDEVSTMRLGVPGGGAKPR